MYMEADHRDKPDSSEVVAQNFARVTGIADTGDISDEHCLRPPSW